MSAHQDHGTDPPPDAAPSTARIPLKRLPRLQLGKHSSFAKDHLGTAIRDTKAQYRRAEI
jgi:hypothetical protein